MMLLEEQQIEHYRILRSLGSGKVYLAKDTRLDRLVAIRVMDAEALSGAPGESAQEVRRLALAKVEKIARLDHPSIVPVYHYGVETIDDATFVYVVTPFCKEGSLIDWLLMQPGSGLLSPWATASLITQVARSLQYAHTQQVIHQHLTPSMLLVRRKLESQDAPDLWVTGFEPGDANQVAPGDPLYMAPEQWAGGSVPATDLYALAVIAYRLLTGELPFKGSQEQVKERHLHLQPQPPSKLVADLPPLLDTVLLKALAKQPEKRFISMTAFASAFSEAAQSKNALCSTLVISEAEAQRSVSRMITLPGDRRISLAVPAGAYDGQIIRLSGQGLSTNQDGAGEDLFVVISIDETLPDSPDLPAVVEEGSDAPTLIAASLEKTEHASSPQGDTGDELTLRGLVSTQKSSPETPIPPAYPITPIPPPPPGQERITAPIPRAELFADEPTLKHIPPFDGEQVVPLPAHNQAAPIREQPQPALQMASSFTKTIRDAFDTSLAPRLQNAAHAPLVMRARSLPGIKNILILVLACLIIIGASSLFYTSSVNQQVTSALQASATAQIRTVSQDFDSTVAAQASVTATAAYDPYPPVHGSLVFADPLRDNGKGHGWQEVGSGCTFIDASYQVSRSDQGLNTCMADETLSNFAYQVQMTITQGDSGGLVFRDDDAHSTFYYFSISSKGSYALSYSQDTNVIPILGPSASAAIQTGTGQPNLLAVVVRGRNIDLYANNQHLAGITDASVVSGQIGVAAESSGNSTEVTFRDAKVWNN